MLIRKLPQDEEKSNKIFSIILKPQLAYLKKFGNLAKKKFLMNKLFL